MVFTLMTRTTGNIGNTMASLRNTLAAGCLACGLALAGGVSADADAVAAGSAKAKPAQTAKKPAKAATGVAKAAPGPGRMQVEEPKASAPMTSARESKAWQKNHARAGLTDAQKQAFRERKQKMEGMIAVIKEKRKALSNAKPEERAALARELHSLILEKDPAAQSGSTTATARVADKSQAPSVQTPAPQTASQEAAKKIEAAEARRQQRIEAYQAQQKKLAEELKQKLEKHLSGDDED
jgi:hypothetical protein